MNLTSQHAVIKTALSCAALAGLTWLGQSTAFALPLDTVKSTGVDAMGTPLADGATDPHWQVSVGVGGTFVSAVNDRNNVYSGGWNEWPLGNQMTSRGITHPSHVRDSDAPSRFVWRQSFNVPAGADASTVTLSYQVGYDDLSRNAMDTGNLTGCNHTVWLNGTAYPMTSTGNPTRTQCVGSIPAGSAFVTGQNTLEFRIANAGGYYGFRFDGVQATYELASVCGDGLIEGNEMCDDGNATSGDGCSDMCAVEMGFECEEPELVFNGDFELGDTGTGGVLTRDTNPLQSRCGTMDVSPRDGFYHVTSSPFHSCECDGGQGLCLALNGGGGAVWSQTLTGLLPNTTYTVSARHALKPESNPSNEPILNLVVDGTTLASASPSSTVYPVPYDTIEATFTTGPAQTTALLEFTNPITVTGGNDGTLDTISVTGPSICTPPCGDGAITMGEACDDGNTTSGDGCSDSCEIESGWECMGEPSMCMLLCGNGTLDAGEACDDGNTTSGDGCSSTCKDERVNMELYSTGVNDQSVPLADGATDTHWEVAVDSDPFVAAINDKNNRCLSCSGKPWIEWPIGNQSTSRGITHPSFVRQAVPQRRFTWRQKFTLPAGARPDTATITYRVGFDEFSRNAMDTGNLTGCNHTAWLNGTAYPMTATGDRFRTQCEATIPAGSAFVTGQNTLEFRISNVTTFYGFRLDKIEGTFLLSCGDGTVGMGETCDDGNTDAGDGCDAMCQVESGWECTGEPSTCVLSCGNGTLEMGETCDDGNMDDGDGCSATCATEEGYTCTGEPSVCQANPVCGDQKIEGSETCDDGNTDAGDGCDAMCQTEEGYTCEGMPSVCQMVMSMVVCGDGQIGTGEACDDGNTDDGDGCSSSCKVEAGYTCKEEPSICELMTAAAKCGDGAIDGMEACDDGNTNDGDGCSSSCKVEEGYNCNGEPSACERADKPAECGNNMVEMGETCDDGNTTSGDGCSDSCSKEEGLDDQGGGGTKDEGCSSTGSSAPSDGTWLFGLLLGFFMLGRRKRR